MEISSRVVDDALIATVDAQRIDSAVAVQFKDKMREVTENGFKRVILDLSNVNFLDSSGLGAVVAAMKQLGSERTLEIAGLTGAVEKVFKLTRMDTVFIIHPNAGAATSCAS
ncbi:STAS domain-containing protein [Falsihalocynthiibacter arcticus]|uniref:Anti-sigma factor antagonist n=1 Tax=Falsihalocynthiibacter arcticus TaxID=1579316 RepID=A0A126UXJ1_9RHOB|nr:STAS domain-containing protein [Falsihalocynthiibacter arcticus]AML50783.1 anti-anti-sigma factor [Falsihalocynthiibacter arcticus]